MAGESFSYSGVQSHMSTIQGNFESIGSSLSSASALVTQGLSSPDEAMYGEGASKILATWDENSSSLEDFMNVFDDWSSMVVSIGNKYASLENNTYKVNDPKGYEALGEAARANRTTSLKTLGGKSGFTAAQNRLQYTENGQKRKVQTEDQFGIKTDVEFTLENGKIIQKETYDKADGYYKRLEYDPDLQKYVYKYYDKDGKEIDEKSFNNKLAENDDYAGKMATSYINAAAALPLIEKQIEEKKKHMNGSEDAKELNALEERKGNLAGYDDKTMPEKVKMLLQERQEKIATAKAEAEKALAAIENGVSDESKEESKKTSTADGTDYIVSGDTTGSDSLQTPKRMALKSGDNHVGDYTITVGELGKILKITKDGEDVLEYEGDKLSSWSDEIRASEEYGKKCKSELAAIAVATGTTLFVDGVTYKPVGNNRAVVSWLDIADQQFYQTYDTEKRAIIKYEEIKAKSMKIVSYDYDEKGNWTRTVTNDYIGGKDATERIETIKNSDGSYLKTKYNTPINAASSQTVIGRKGVYTDSNGVQHTMGFKQDESGNIVFDGNSEEDPHYFSANGYIDRSTGKPNTELINSVLDAQSEGNRVHYTNKDIDNNIAEGYVGNAAQAIKHMSLKDGDVVVVSSTDELNYVYTTQDNSSAYVKASNSGETTTLVYHEATSNRPAYFEDMRTYPGENKHRYYYADSITKNSDVTDPVNQGYVINDYRKLTETRYENGEKVLGGSYNGNESNPLRGEYYNKALYDKYKDSIASASIGNNMTSINDDGSSFEITHYGDPGSHKLPEEITVSDGRNDITLEWDDNLRQYTGTFVDSRGPWNVIFDPSTNQVYYKE